MFLIVSEITNCSVGFTHEAKPVAGRGDVRKHEADCFKLFFSRNRTEKNPRIFYSVEIEHNQPREPRIGLFPATAREAGHKYKGGEFLFQPPLLVVQAAAFRVVGRSNLALA